MSILRIISLSALLLFSATRLLQAQINNECAGAIGVALNIPISSSNTGATQSLPPNTCNGFVTPGQAKDVWFSFVYESGMDSVLADPGPNPDADIVAELFAGTCGNLTPVTCSNFAEQLSSNQSEGFFLPALGLNTGQTYYFRVYGSGGIETNLTIRIKTVLNPPAPPNNECQTAQLINAGQILPGNSVGATQSLAPVACNGFTSSEALDVWYRFTKNPAMNTLLLYPETSDMVLQVFTGTCTGLVSSSCSDVAGLLAVEQISLTAIPNGTTCFARVYGRNGTGGGFILKISSPPSNDNCEAASELIPNLVQNGKTVDASQSSPPSSCGGTSDDDVWYHFTKGANMDSLVLTPGNFFNPVMEIRSSPCSTSAGISCQHTGGKVVLPLGTLTSGTKYFVRIYSHSGEPGTFNLRLFQSAGPIPSNDQCVNAQAINPAIGVVFNANNVGATQSLPSPPCGGEGSSLNRDVWYSFVRTAARDTLELDGLGFLDVMADIRSACSPDSMVACLDLMGSDKKTLDLIELSEGKTYYLRVYGRNGGVGDFNLRFLENTVIPGPPPNNDCFSATLLTLGTSCSLITGTNISSDATAGLALPSCASGVAKDVWYRFQANATRAIVKLACAPGFDGVVEVLSGSCFAPVSRACINEFPASNDPDFPIVEELFLNNLTAGQSYFIRIFGNNGSTGNFSVCVFHPNCNSTAATLSLGNSSILSNQAFTATLGSAQGQVAYQISSGGGAFLPLAVSETNTLDTLVFASSVGGSFSLRAMSRQGECYPAFSAGVPLTVRCATPFIETNPFIHIQEVKISNLNNSSSVNLLGGSVQDFSALSAIVCKGASYVLSLKSSLPGGKLLAWADFNQDGDYGDAAEALLTGSISDTLLQNYPVIIPATAVSGSTRMRVMVVSEGSNVSGSNPCAPGPYESGEIEEYSLNISSGTIASAGSDQNTGCNGSASLSGNSPGAGNSGIWSLVSGFGEISNPASANTTVNNLGPGANVFRWSLTNSCGTSTDDLTITSNRSFARAGADFTACSSTTSLNATNPSPGTGTWSVISGSAVIANPAQFNSAVSNLSQGTNQLRWLVNSTGCPSASDTLNITREINPAWLGSDTLICAPFSLTLNAPAGLSNYQWNVGFTGTSITIGNFGVYWLQATTPSGCVFRDSISVQSCNSVTAAMKNAGFRIYPNPGKGKLVISSNEAMEGTLELDCVNAQGKIILSRNLEMNHSRAEFEPELPAGMYLMRLKKAGSTLAAFRIIRE